MTREPRPRRAADDEGVHPIAPPAGHRAALAAAKRSVRQHPGVVGVDYGYIYTAGIRTGEVGIRYHVSRKRPARLVPPGERLPRHVDKLRTDVVEAGFRPHRMDPFAPAAILRPGLSIGNVLRRSDGTLGLFVSDRDDSARCLLSNWHVLCGGRDARAGDPISQPGPLYLGPNHPREIAQLRRWIAPAKQYDVAIAAVSPSCPVDAMLFDSEIAITGLADPELGMTVVKAGTATGVTHALVDAVGGIYKVPYDDFGDRNRWMHGIRLVPHPDYHGRDVSLPGDSGSAWVDVKTGRGVGLNFAGEDDEGPLNEYALAHSLPEVCRALRVDVV